MEFVIKKNNANLTVRLIAVQCYDIIANFPEDCQKKNLRSSIYTASELSQKLDKILMKRDYIKDWKHTTALHLQPKHMSYKELSKTVTRTGIDIHNFCSGLEVASTNFAMLFEGMKVTDNCMRPFDMRDDLFIIKFYEHILKVQDAVNEIENNLEKLKSSVYERSTKKSNSDRCESPSPYANKRVRYNYEYPR